MTTHDIKDDYILLVYSQEPSASSKYDFEDRGVLEALSSSSGGAINLQFLLIY